MDKFRINLRNKIDKYVKLNGLNYEYFKKSRNTGSLQGILRKGSTSFKTLLELSKFLNVDVRNFLIFDECTYVFENYFDTLEGFMVFIGKRLKRIRVDKGITAQELGKRVGRVQDSAVYCVEASTMNISLKRFYEFLNALEVTPDEFFLKDENYEIIGNQIKNQISIDNFNNRIYEIEEIKGRIVKGNIFNNPNNFPTLHGFLKICKSLRVSPKDFFDFDKKDFDDNFKIVDITNSANFIKQKLESSGVKVQRYIKLDSIFFFCDKNNLHVKDFFENLYINGNDDQTLMKFVKK